MKQITLEWVEKAEGDYLTAKREVVVDESPNYDAVCFHCQQSAEKYLKARLQGAGLPFPRFMTSLSSLTASWYSSRPGKFCEKVWNH